MRDDRFGFPYASFPSGWFQIAWSADIGAGEIKPLRYFGQDLVVFRTESGQLAVLDAHCPHMGAHLAYGNPRSVRRNGSVLGECIECPWHGWQWDVEGRNVEIPYSTRPNKAQRIRTWVVREMHGVVLLWHDELGREPFWEPPGVPEFESSNFYPLLSGGATRVWRNQTVKPQYLVENTPDIAHTKWVHGNPEVAYDATFEFDGPISRSSFKIVYGTGRHAADGEIGRTTGYVTCEVWGVGVIINRLYGMRENVMLVCTTPVDHEHSDVFCSNVTVKVEGLDGPDELGRKIIDNQLKEVEADLAIWAHERYVAHAPFVPEEAAGFMALRRHTRQFYPDGDVQETVCEAGSVPAER